MAIDQHNDPLIQSQRFYHHFFSEERQLTYGDRERYEVVFRLIKDLDVPKTVRVLEIGAGSGRISGFLLTQFANVTSIDIIANNLMEQVLQQNEELKFSVAALPYLPFSNQSFDVVIFSEVLEHLDSTEQERAITQIAQLLAPDGWCILSTPNPASFFQILRNVVGHIKHGDKQLSGQLMENHIVPTKLQKMLREHFLIAKRLGSFYLIPPVRLTTSSRFLTGLSEMIRKRNWLVDRGLYQYYVLRRVDSPRS